MENIDGYLIPSGTFVYYFKMRSGMGIIRTASDNEKIEHFKFIFGLRGDGLYATPAARYLWDGDVTLHPHCTLFEMLRDKLKI